MNAHAVWDDGHGVGIPGKVLAELEVAWRQAERWNVVHFVPAACADRADVLDSLEKHLADEVAVKAARRQHTILTHSGPQWSLQPVHPGHQPEQDGQADYCSWTRGTPLPYGGDWWLACRMSGLSIPMLAHEQTK